MSQWATLIMLGFGKPNGLEKWYLHPKDSWLRMRNM